VFAPKAGLSGSGYKLGTVAYDRTRLVSPHLEPFFVALDAASENLEIVALAVDQAHCLDRPGSFLTTVFLDIYAHLLNNPFIS
jgi:hypothetical protein